MGQFPYNAMRQALHLFTVAPIANNSIAIPTVLTADPKPASRGLLDFAPESFRSFSNRFFLPNVLTRATTKSTPAFSNFFGKSKKWLVTQFTIAFYITSFTHKCL
jgi:hypothetical protein